MTPGISSRLKFPGVWRILNPTVFRIPKIWRFFSICPEIRNEFFKPSYVVGHFWGFAFRNVWNDPLGQGRNLTKVFPSHPGLSPGSWLVECFWDLGWAQGRHLSHEWGRGRNVKLIWQIDRKVCFNPAGCPRNTKSVFCSFEELLGFWGVVRCSVLTWRDIYLFKLLSWTRHTEGRTSCVEFPWRQLHEWMKTRQGLNIRVYQSKIFKQKASLQDFCFSSFSHAFQAPEADTPSIAPGGLKVVVGSSNMARQKSEMNSRKWNGSMGQHGGIRRIQNFLLKNQSRTSWFIRFLPGFCAFFFWRADSCRWVGQFGHVVF